jgi:hypothetical protein
MLASNGAAEQPHLGLIRQLPRVLAHLNAARSAGASDEDPAHFKPLLVMRQRANYETAPLVSGACEVVAVRILQLGAAQHSPATS